MNHAISIDENVTVSIAAEVTYACCSQSPVLNAEVAVFVSGGPMLVCERFA